MLETGWCMMRDVEQVLIDDVDETIINFEMAELLMEYDEAIFQSLTRHDYPRVEEKLSNFCLDLLRFSEKKQRTFAKVYFTSILTELIRMQLRKKLLHAELVAHSYRAIEQIERWDNISEFIMNIPFFMKQLEKIVMAEHSLFITNKHVKRAVRLIEQNLKSEWLSVSWLANALSISTTYLSNLFKVEIGETASTYMTKRKLKEITYELRYTNKSIAEIRESYGFKNQSNFIQHFKRHIGMTPLQYKQRSYDVREGL